jgi:DNA gyrase subunit A
LLIALANLDDVIQTIRESPDAEIAKERLMSRFELTEIQAQAILDMQLRRLAALERQKIVDEHKQIMSEIEYLEDLLANPKKILEIIRGDLNEIAETYGDERRTQIAPDATTDLSEESLVKKEDVFVSLTQKGYVKRVSESTYRSQGRGGRGVIGQSMRDEDEVQFSCAATRSARSCFLQTRARSILRGSGSFPTNRELVVAFRSSTSSILRMRNRLQPWCRLLISVMSITLCWQPSKGVSSASKCPNLNPFDPLV